MGLTLQPYGHVGSLISQKGLERSVEKVNKMKQIKTAIFGTGFIGRVHLDTVRRL